MAADVLIMIWKPLPWKKAPARVLALMLLNSDPGHHGKNTKGHNTAETAKNPRERWCHHPAPCWGQDDLLFLIFPTLLPKKEAKKPAKVAGRGVLPVSPSEKKLMSRAV